MFILIELIMMNTFTVDSLDSSHAKNLSDQPVSNYSPMVNSLIQDKIYEDATCITGKRYDNNGISVKLSNGIEYNEQRQYDTPPYLSGIWCVDIPFGSIQRGDKIWITNSNSWLAAFIKKSKNIRYSSQKAKYDL